MERFWAKVEKSDGCWNWTGKLERRGLAYGRFKYLGFDISAHRFAWRLSFGRIPDGQVVMHLCDNPKCVRIEHLKLGSQAENMADMRAKGRARARARPPLVPYANAGLKQCILCREVKELAGYWSDRTRPDRLQRRCISCEKTYRAQRKRIASGAKS